MMERARSSSDNDEQLLLSKDRSHLWRSVPSQVTTGQIQQHNIVRIRAGPTSYFTSSIMHGIPLSSFRIFFNEPTLKNILKCTTSEAHRVIGNNSWTVTLDELDKLMGLIVARGAIGGRILPIKNIWDKSWGCPLFKDWTRSGDANFPTDLVMKLIIPLFSQSFNVTCNNYFTSLDLLLRLAKRQCSLVATIPANRRKITDLLKKKRMLHSAMAVHTTGDTTATITSYQCKQPKFLNTLSTLHKNLLFQST